MNCFEWQSHVSDYLDGALPPVAQANAAEHLKECAECTERHKRYRLILGAIAGQPRSTLPVPIRKSPFSAILPRLEISAHPGATGMAARFPFWDRIPWYFRIPLEGAGIVLVILVGISAGPKLRAIYESRIEKSLTEFSDNQASGLDPGLSSASVPLARGKSETEDADEAFSAGEGGDQPETSSAASDDVRAGRAEVWRFNLKTDSPHEFRPKIVKILADLGISSKTPGFGGIEAPGGIQFDLLVAQSLVPEIKKQLEKAAPAAAAGVETGPDAPLGEPFTWYKNQSKKPIPRGQTRVVIWLSQT